MNNLVLFYYKYIKISWTDNNVNINFIGNMKPY